MDIGAGTEASIEAAPQARGAGAPQRAITERILELADGAGYAAALIDADPKTPRIPKDLRDLKAPENPGTPEDPVAGGTVTTWLQFARTVRAAARGLSRRGLRDTDTVAIFVQDAASHAVASHAVRAAGAVAQSVHPASVADVAGQLKASRARLLITSAALAQIAVLAAERSLVRQVFAFGEAPGTTPFSSLLASAKHGQLDNGGSARTAPASATARIPDLAGLVPTDGPGPRLTRRDVVVAGPPCGDADTYSSLLDLVLLAGATIVAAPLPRITAAIHTYKGTAAIVPRGTDVPAIPAERVFTVAAP